MLRVITMTAYRRPAYTREVLAASAQCGSIGDWLLLPNVEPGHEEVIDAFRQWTARESRLAVNKERPSAGMVQGEPPDAVGGGPSRKRRVLSLGPDRCRMRTSAR